MDMEYVMNTPSAFGASPFGASLAGLLPSAFGASPPSAGFAPSPAGFPSAGLAPPSAGLAPSAAGLLPPSAFAVPLPAALGLLPLPLLTPWRAPIHSILAAINLKLSESREHTNQISKPLSTIAVSI